MATVQFHPGEGEVDKFLPQGQRYKEWFDGFYSHSPEARTNEIPVERTEKRVVNGRKVARFHSGQSDNWKATQYHTSRPNPLADRMHQETRQMMSDDRALYIAGLKRDIEAGYTLRGPRLRSAQRLGLVG